MTVELQREHMQRLMALLVEREPQVRYLQLRPMRTRYLNEPHLRDNLDAGGTIAVDCSEAVTLICRLAGLRDPNGRGYDGTGYTGSLLDNLRHYRDPSAARPGALCVYGPRRGEHVAMVYEPGEDPLMFTHGAPDEPRFERHSVLAASLRKPWTFLSVAEL